MKYKEVYYAIVPNEQKTYVLSRPYDSLEELCLCHGSANFVKALSPANESSND